MLPIYRPYRVLISLFTVTAFIMGCAATSSIPTPTSIPRPLPDISTDSAWWHVRFNMDWPEGAVPSWHMDLLIAHLIIKPCLERYQPDISLWRFHRRASRDAAGHRFSFIFFAPPAVARKIFTEISKDQVFQDAYASGRILKLECEDTETATRTSIGDTSDPQWSAPLRQAWPYYLMGASRMWLDLICRMVPGDQAAETVSNFGELQNLYSEVNASITALWQNEGRHAFLHHLNALFGYEPLIIIEKRHMRF